MKTQSLTYREGENQLILKLLDYNSRIVSSKAK